MEKEFKYDAFISYRHCDLDKYVAENLHKILENYDLPKSIKEKLNIEGRSIKRVFRDQEELPLASNLEDPIIEALENSKYLIVICSPRLKESLWCKKEIETFKKIRGRKKIFCVLVEGEPSDSFPEEVLYDIKEVEKNGKKTKEKILVEPLAADVRGINKKDVLKKIKEEKLRLIAGMFNLNYDDLKQRHKLRKQKRMICTSIVVAISCLLFALYTSIMLIKINRQQNILKKHQAITLSTKAKNYLKKDNRYDAIKSSYQALTKYNGVKMPYTTDAEYALSSSLGVYDAGDSYKAINEVKTKGVVRFIKTSEDNKYFAIYDGSEEINLYNSKTLDKVATYPVTSISYYETSFDFIGNNILSFINEKGNISLVNVKDGKLIKEIKKVNNSYSSLKGNNDGKYLIYNDNTKLYIYNMKNNKITSSIKTKGSFIKEMYYSSDNEYIFVGTTNSSFEFEKEENINLHVIKIKDGTEINSKTIEAGYLNGIVTKGDNAYLLLNSIIDNKNNMLVISYNFIKGDTNWSKKYEGLWGKLINKSYPKDTNNIAVATYDNVKIIDAASGETVETFNVKSEIINLYSYYDREIYLVFTDKGTVNFINMKNKTNVVYPGEFNFNVKNYSDAVQSSNGFLLTVKNDNRVILYEKKSNKKIKEVNIKNTELKENSVRTSKIEKIVKKYNVKNKDLVNRIFYDNKKELMFVNYTNNDLAIYRVKDKTLLKKYNNIGIIKYYFGCDTYNRIYIGDEYDSYILDKNYNKVGHITNLFKVDKDKVIVSNNKKYYSIKIYTLNELKKEAKDYLK